VDGAKTTREERNLRSGGITKHGGVYPQSWVVPVAERAGDMRTGKMDVVVVERKGDFQRH